MKLDKRALSRIAMMSDAQLKELVEKLSTEYGVDLSGFQVRPGDMDGLRRALRNATDEDLAELTRQLKNGRRPS